MRRGLVATVLAVASIVPIAITGSLSHSYAQVGIGGPQGDEFNNDVFAAPFRVQCGTNAFPQPCPDAPGTGTYNLNREALGYLRIYTQPGSLLGQSNNARNLILQPFNPSYDFAVFTKVSFPGFNFQTNPAPLGQTAGLLEYDNQENFIYVGRVFSGNGTSGVSQLQFLQEVGGVDTSYTLTENNLLGSTVYFELRKSGNVFQGYYSYDGQNYLPFTVPPATVNPSPTATLTPTATATGAPTATATSTTATATPVPQQATFTVSGFASTGPQIGVFAYGGTNPQVATNVIPADFDWFRVNNPATPAATALPTATGTASATATATVTNTPVPTSTTVATATSTAVPTSTATALPTATATATITPVPTNTPTPKKRNPVVGFKYVSIWYHQVRRGTFEHLEVQAKKSVKHGIWVHVYFPTGIHYDYYTETDDTGHWVKEFNIPSDSVSKYSNEAVVTFQLWKGKTTGKNFATFFVVR